MLVHLHAWMVGWLVFEDEESLDERRPSGRSVPEDIGSEQAFFFDATHQDMPCERQWHSQLFIAGSQCLLSHVDISHVCSCFFAARTLQHLLQIGQYRRQPSRCCNFINTDLQSSEFCIFLYDVCQWLPSWVQLMLWTLAVASSMRFLMLFASFLFILSEVQNFLFVQATPGRHSGPSILEATFQWAFNLKLIVEEKGVRVA